MSAPVEASSDIVFPPLDAEWSRQLLEEANAYRPGEAWTRLEAWYAAHPSALTLLPRATRLNAAAWCQRLVSHLPAVVKVLGAQRALERMGKESLVRMAIQLWLPLVEQLIERVYAHQRPWVQGLLGVQGTGKTTLGVALGALLELRGLRLLALSIDDFYLSYEARRQMQAHAPELRWRGPPGTHDVPLALETLAALKAGEAVRVPRFDKSLHAGQGDRVEGEQMGPGAVDVVLLEGWCVGLAPLEADELSAASAKLEVLASEEARTLAELSRQRLGDYEGLWGKLDGLWVMKPEDYRQSLRWRQAAELSLREATGSGMSDAEIEAFVHYFWQSLHPELYLSPLRTRVPNSLVLQLDAARCPVNARVASS